MATRIPPALTIIGAADGGFTVNDRRANEFNGDHHSTSLLYAGSLEDCLAYIQRKLELPEVTPCACGKS